MFKLRWFGLGPFKSQSWTCYIDPQPGRGWNMIRYVYLKPIYSKPKTVNMYQSPTLGGFKHRTMIHSVNYQEDLNLDLQSQSWTCYIDP